MNEQKKVAVRIRGISYLFCEKCLIDIKLEISSGLTAGDLHWHASMNSSSLGLGRESRGSMSKVGVEQNRCQEYLRGQDILHFSFEQVQVHGIHVQVQKLLAGKAGKKLFL